MNVYLITFMSSNSPFVERQEVLNYLNTQSNIKNWYAVMPNAILVVTPEDHNFVTKIIADRFRHNMSFIVTDAKMANGSINKQVWDFINEPKSSGRWA